jgi:peroxiredoxin
MKSRVFLLLLIAAGCSKHDAPDARSSARVEVGQPAPAYRATTMTGSAISLADMTGKPVLMNVWATWCGPCRQEIPELRAIHGAYKDRGLEVVGVSVDADGSDDAIRDFVEEFRMDYTIWRDPTETVQATFHMAGVPTTFLIDKQGVLRWRSTGALQPGDSSLTRAIQEALK